MQFNAIETTAAVTTETMLRVLTRRWTLLTAALTFTPVACGSSGDTADAGETDATGATSHGDASTGHDDPTTAGGSETEGTGGSEMASQPRLRRLSNVELGNTLDAVLAVQPAALGQLPPDQRTFVFDRIAAAQTISPVHLDAFTAIADEAHRTLIAEQRLDALASACRDDLLPPAIAEAHVRVAGVAMLAEPVWAACRVSCQVGDPLADDAVYLLYANPDSGAVTHSFPAPTAGRYALSLRIQTKESMTVTLFADQVAVETWPVASDGNAPIELATIQSLDAGAHELRFQFSSNNEVIHIFQLTIDGPLDEVDAPEERRTCAQALIDGLAPLAYRRPLAADERARLLAVYDAGVADGSFHDATRMLFEAILTSPYFLYLVELGAPEDDRPGWYRLSDWELAARLSYSLCERPPDAALRKAAAAGELATDDALREHADRLLADPCRHATIARFYRQ